MSSDSRVEVNGIELHYAERGEGPALLLLHGGMLDSILCFGDIIPSLALRHRVVTVDLQGHGRTPDNERPITLPNLAADVAGLIEHLGGGPIDVAGYSLGGLVAIELAVSRPELVDRLALLSAHVRADGYHPEIMDPRPGVTSARLPTEADFAAMHDAYRANAADPDHFFDLMEKLQPAIAAFEGWTDEQLAGIAGPTLIVVGDLDFVRLDHALLMLDRFPSASLAVLPATTHMALPQRTELLAPMLEAHLAREP
jgi:pimeloyl-ACP methyl ester carboxylesterase